MRRTDKAFVLGRLSVGVLLSLYTASAVAQTLEPSTAVYAEDWLPVYPQVSVNGSMIDGLFAFMSQHGRLFIENDTLIALGVRLPAATLGAQLPQRGNWLALDDIGELNVHYNAATQSLSLTAPLTWLNLPTTYIGADQSQAYAIARPSYAAVFNYDYNATRSSHGNQSHGLLLESRLTTPAGYLSHNHLWRHHQDTNRHSSQKNIRLDTYWRSTLPEQGLILTVGDVLTGNGSGGSRLGGIKLEHSYRTQPWRSTTPLRAYVGETTLPSTVDLYVNGVKQYSQDVNAGQYEITLPPSISGSGVAQVVATDILGRQVVVNMPLYRGTGMLAKGLNEWSLETGYLRRGYGVHDFDYDDTLVASGALRYGLSHFVTTQLHAQGARGYHQFGAAATTVLGSLGQLNLSHAHSQFKQHKDSRSSVFFSTQRGAWSFGAGWSRYGNGFSELGIIANPNGFEPKSGHTQSASASLGWGSPKLGSFSLSYLHNQRSHEPSDNIGTFSWSINAGKRISLYLNATHNFNDRRQRSVYGGLSFSFDKGYALNASSQSGAQATQRVSFGKSSSGLGSPSWNIGWQQQDNGGGKHHAQLNGYLNYDSQYADFRGSVYHAQNSTNWNAGVRGGVVLMRGDIFASRNINDSFAVVSTNGMANIPVKLFNNKVGKTNQKGLLLVPNLSAYQKNPIELDITDLPENVQAAQARVEAVPTARSGVAVDFKLDVLRAAAFSLKNADSQFIREGAMIKQADGSAVAVVGFDGRSFIEQLAEGHNRFYVSLPENGGSCYFDIDYQSAQYGDSLPDLGDILCISQPLTQN